MVRIPRSVVRAYIVLGGMLAATALAQQPSAAPTADKLTADWFTLASALETRVTRMLPCDPRVRTAIDEVSRANASRLAARNAYWQSQAAQSRAQLETLRNLQTTLATEAAEAKTDAADVQQEQAGLAGMNTDLTDSASKKPALNAAVNALSDISQQSAALLKLPAERETTIASLQQQITEAITASEARQTAIEAEQRALGAEGARWTSYYAARLTRAQMECAITGQGPKPAPPKTLPPKAEYTPTVPAVQSTSPTTVAANAPAATSTQVASAAASTTTMPVATATSATTTSATTASATKAAPAQKTTKRRRRR
ncbi:MAG: hypothetical protein ABL967_09775 [Bryobacteraceae bacterium]